MAADQWIKNADGSWSYYNSDGSMQKGWEEYNEKWYYLDFSGKMVTGWIKESNDTWEYFKESMGERETGWICDDGEYYYLNSNGE